ncbi:hypothetical protein HOLleu_19007 [Holothuria leucospilota]|uniref:C-type lectin domain-containing protein n=1 Tax=Holothuria leucospilota TaxID=206669 RepID=A0A9Q1H9J9_HOLLE|nr:hypothetical protein HOLleu_19007 [Holothuria leucospilota]
MQQQRSSRDQVKRKVLRVRRIVDCVVTIFVTSPFGVDAQLGCPTSWVRSDGNCFKVVFLGRDTSYNAEEADDHCKSLGGRIASIHSEEDFNALRGSWPNGCCLYYFGLRRNESGHWGYTDTTRVLHLILIPSISAISCPRGGYFVSFTYNIKSRPLSINAPNPHRTF